MRGIKKFFYIIIIALIIGAILYIIPQFEWHSPTVDIKLDTGQATRQPGRHVRPSASDGHGSHRPSGEALSVHPSSPVGTGG